MSRVFIVVILLISFFWELMDPSTNFIRTRVVAKTKTFEASGHNHRHRSSVCSEQDLACQKNEDASRDQGTAFEDVSVCYAIAESHLIVVKKYSQPRFLLEDQKFIDMYSSEIFQPPEV